MQVLRWLVPRIALRDIGRMSIITVSGALIAGAYGVVHDQVTYSISTEYFTRFKFHQFSYAEPPGGNPRIFAGVIGFLATWWVGALLAWIMARVSLFSGGSLPPVSRFATAFVITFSVSLVVACFGFVYGLWRKSTGYAIGWLEWMDAMAIQDREAFMAVGYIHNSSYLGGCLGTIVAVLYLKAQRRRQNATAPVADHPISR